jgi:hypothetical protein
VIRGLCSNYRELSEIRVFVTNMGDIAEELASEEGCVFSGLMAWFSVHPSSTGSLLRDGPRVLLASPIREEYRSACQAFSYACRTHGYQRVAAGG